MQQAMQFQSQFPAPGPTLVEAGQSNLWPITGVSPSWRKLLLQAEMAAPHVQLATIEGESGSGKQTLARYLLSHSPLAGSPFHRKDAREWLLEGDAAQLSGFTYLDRVDLLASAGQGLLLKVMKHLQDRPTARVLLVASSQTSLRQMAGQGLLLPDLAFRLTAVRFAIPPLRMRKEDIPPIAQALLDRLCSRYQHRPVELGPGALARLLQHAWPGNVRELASIIESALLDADSNVIRPGDLAVPVSGDNTPPAEAMQQQGSFALNDVIQRHVQYVLDVNRGNKLRSARQLGISRSTLYRILANEAVLAGAY
jgi:DNA-binding NtrC family response regulator